MMKNDEICHFIIKNKDGRFFRKENKKMQFFKKLKNLIVSALLVTALIVPSTVAFAAEDVVQGQEIETPASVQEAIAELQQDQSDERVFSFPETYADISDSVNIAAYRDRNFTGRSAPEPLVLRKSCDTISLIATCAAADTTDVLVFYIIDETHNGDFNTTLPFTANGSTETIACSLPEGQYRVYFTCTSLIEEAIAVFSKWE